MPFTEAGLSGFMCAMRNQVHLLPLQNAFMTGELAACADSCVPGSLHFINGIFVKLTVIT